MALLRVSKSSSSSTPMLKSVPHAPNNNAHLPANAHNHNTRADGVLSGARPGAPTAFFKYGYFCRTLNKYRKKSSRHSLPDTTSDFPAKMSANQDDQIKSLHEAGRLLKDIILRSRITIALPQGPAHQSHLAPGY